MNIFVSIAYLHLSVLIGFLLITQRTVHQYIYTVTKGPNAPSHLTDLVD